MAQSKATTEQKTQRTQAVVEWILGFVPTWEIIARAKTEWKIDERQAKRYLQDARKAVRDTIERDRQKLVQDRLVLIAQLEWKLYEREEFKTLVALMKHRDDLIGLRFDRDDHLRVLLEAGYEIRKPED